MLKKNLPVLILALAAAAAVFLFLTGISGEGTVVVAARNLSPGTLIKPGDLELRKMRAVDIPASAVRGLKEAEGKYLSVYRAKGDLLLRDQVGERAAGSGDALPAGTVAVAVPASLAQAVGGLLRPGDRVTVVAVGGSGVGGARARAIARGVLVISVPPSLRGVVEEQSGSGQPGGGGLLPVSESAVTLAVPTAVVEAEGRKYTAAEAVSAAVAQGKVWLVLEKPGEEFPAGTGGVDMGWLLGPAAQSTPNR